VLKGQIVLLKERKEIFEKPRQPIYAMVVKSYKDKIVLAINYSDPMKYKEIEVSSEQILKNSNPKYLIFVDYIGFCNHMKRLGIAE